MRQHPRQLSPQCGRARKVPSSTRYYRPRHLTLGAGVVPNYTPPRPGPPAPRSLSDVETVRAAMQGRERPRSGQRLLDRLEQRLDAEIDERSENLVVVRGHKQARPEHLHQVKRKPAA